MAHDDPREGVESPVPDRAENAVVVQFGAETDARQGTVAERIEHLQTGRRSRFASIDDLLAFVKAMLAGIESSRRTHKAPDGQSALRRLTLTN
jgi:hypothetical protein